MAQEEQVLVVERKVVEEVGMFHGLMFDVQKYVDKLFAASNLEWGELLRMAEELGQDRDDFEKCMKSEDIFRAIQEDVEHASALKLRGTPVFFVNGYKFEGSKTFKEMSMIIDAFLHGMEPRR